MTNINPLLTAALFTKTKKCKQLKCPSVDEGVNTMGSNRILDHYSALKRKEILLPATSWVNLEDIVLSEISQSPKNILYDSTYMRPSDFSNL